MKVEDIFYPIDWEPRLVDILYDEIFKDEIYTKFFDFKENDIVLDLGANIGVYSLYAIEKMPSINKIYMVEPFMQNFDYMVRNIMHNRKDDIHKFIFIKAAISKNGFYGVGGTDIGICLNSLELSDITEQTKTFSLVDFIKFYNIEKVDIIKMDIEGSELEMFNDDAFNYINDNNINRICGELHPKKKYGEEMFNILNRFKNMGYEILVTSVDGYDITTKMLNNLIVNDDKKAWEYYNQFLFYKHYKFELVHK